MYPSYSRHYNDILYALYLRIVMTTQFWSQTTMFYGVTIFNQSVDIRLSHLFDKVYFRYFSYPYNLKQC